MKLRNDDLKTLYRRSLQARPDGKTSCPSEDAILKSFTVEMSEEEKFRIIDHMAGCGACRLKFEAAREILKGAKALAGELEGQSLSGDETAALRQRALEKIRELGRGPQKEEKKSISDRLRIFIFQYRYASVVAGVFMVALAAWLVLKSPQGGRDNVVRGIKEPVIALESPRGIQAEVPALFRWRSPWEGGEAEVRVLNEELDMIWSSGRIRATSLEFPPSLSEIIEREKIHYWKVIVYLDDGRINESDLQEFQLKN